MPVIRKSKPQHPRHQEFANEIQRHLHGGDTLPDFPKIFEENFSRSASMHVYVIWQEWGEIKDTERSEIILEAYEQEKGRDFALTISVAIGLTPLEAREMGI